MVQVFLGSLEGLVGVTEVKVGLSARVPGGRGTRVVGEVVISKIPIVARAEHREALGH
ncbi:MAG TPA: hypothetical protein VGD65_11090 [Chryseosolibacter sp.]